MSDWWRGAVIYQVYPRSFADSNGDGIGDLRGLLGRLDYIADLGVDAVWVSPFYTSPMRDFGYDVADFCGVDPIFGTLADFDAILARAHALGLKLIIDQVYSHTSDLHPWFLESRSSRRSARADWFVWADPKPDGSPPNNWQSLFMGPAWTWDARRGQYYLHNFLREQPDLNLLNPQVQDAMLGVARFWLNRGVDGFRVDAVSHFTHDVELRDNPVRSGGERTRPVDFQTLLYNSDRVETLGFLGRLRRLLDEYSDRFAMGELGGPDSAGRSHREYLGPGRLQTAYSFLFLRGDPASPAVVKRAVAEWESQHASGWPTWVFSNHDAPRVLTRWGGDDADGKFAQLMNAVLLTLRGSACLYQGEELGLPQAHVPFDRLRDPEAIGNWPRTLGRDGARTPMPWVATDAHGGFSQTEPWLPVDPRHLPLAVDQQHGRGDSVLESTRRLLRLRRCHPALVDGDIEFLPAPESVLAFMRRKGPVPVLCAFNFGKEPARVAVRGSQRFKPLAASSGSWAEFSIVELPAQGFVIALGLEG